MSTKTHKKLCWNCDGYVHLYEMKCPYCGVSLADQKKTPVDDKQDSPLVQSLEQRSEQLQEEVFRPPYQSSTKFETDPLSAAATHEIQKDDENSANKADVENPLFSLILLIPGSVFFILALAMLLFSSDGELVFAFKAKHWAFYMIAAVPLLFFGYRSLRSTKKG